MAAPDGTLPGPTHDDRALVFAEALSVIMDVSKWELSEARWLAIESVLKEMAAALAAGDLAALTEATINLELIGPVRLIKIDSIQGQPSQRIKFRLNRLVQALGGTLPDSLRGHDGDDFDHARDGL